MLLSYVLRTEKKNNGVLPSKMYYIVYCNNKQYTVTRRECNTCIATKIYTELCLVPFAWCVSDVSHVTGIKMELLNRTLKMPLVPGHPVVFGHEKKGFLILPEKCWEPLCAVCEVLVILIRKRALVKNAH